MFSLYRLENPIPGEKVIRLVHRDPFVALKRVGLFVLLLVLPIGIFFIINDSFSTVGEYSWVWVVIILAASIYLLFIWLLFFFSIIDYLLDIWVITDRRIIDVRQNGFFSRTVSEQMLSKIQDISSDTRGFWPTVWKYGNLTVQTAGEKNKLFFEEISNPEEVRDILIKLAALASVNSFPQASPAAAALVDFHDGL